MNALLVEDDPDLGDSLRQILEENGFHVRWAKTGTEALYYGEELDFDVIILDRLLPELGGLDVLRQLRRTSHVPVLMLTALNTVDDRTEGLDAGADDYLGKPFELAELLARVRALVRRSPHLISERMVHGNIILDMLTQKLTRAGALVELSRTEYQAVEYLLRHRGRVITREQLERLLYEDKDVRANPLDVLIHRIRKKLGTSFIRTRRGYGFVVDHDESTL